MPLLSTVGKEEGGGRRRSKMGRKDKVPEEGYGRAAEGYRKRNRVMSCDKRSSQLLWSLLRVL